MYRRAPEDSIVQMMMRTHLTAFRMLFCPTVTLRCQFTLPYCLMKPGSLGLTATYAIVSDYQLENDAGDQEK